MTQLMESIRPFRIPMIALIGASATAFRAPKIPAKISLTPFHARSQSPVNTPRIKSMMPSNTNLMLSHMFFTFEKNAFSRLPRMPKVSLQSRVKMP